MPIVSTLFARRPDPICEPPPEIITPTPAEQNFYGLGGAELVEKFYDHNFNVQMQQQMQRQVIDQRYGVYFDFDDNRVNMPKPRPDPNFGKVWFDTATTTLHVGAWTMTGGKYRSMGIDEATRQTMAAASRYGVPFLKVRAVCNITDELLIRAGLNPRIYS